LKHSLQLLDLVVLDLHCFSKLSYDIVVLLPSSARKVLADSLGIAA
jgi:hypothetical protein